MAVVEEEAEDDEKYLTSLKHHWWSTSFFVCPTKLGLGVIVTKFSPATSCSFVKSLDFISSFYEGGFKCSYNRLCDPLFTFCFQLNVCENFLSSWCPMRRHGKSKLRRSDRQRCCAKEGFVENRYVLA